VPEAAEDGEAEIAAPSEHDAPGEWGAVTSADAEGVEMLEDAGTADEGAVVGREDLAEHGDDASLHGGRVMGGAFASQVALTRH
jgi:hypothetical protein